MEILSAVLGVTSITLVLAILVIIAEKYFNDYGECEIDVNQGDDKLKVQGGNMLLGALAGQKIFIPSACGGKATCGLCKLQVLDGAGPILPTEEPYLSAEERKNGCRLSCQVKIKKDLKVMIPEELFNIKEYQTTILKIDDLTHDIKGVRFKLKDPDQMKFKAGQYMQLHTKPYDKVKETVYRAYSISSAPYEEGEVELIIRKVPGGICTTYVHDHLKEGDDAKISGPYGDFYLRGNVDELIFIAGGSGLAPIKSLVLDIIHQNLDKKMRFFFGAVSKRDLYFVELFDEITKKYPNFQFIPALSRPAEEDHWTGESGLITEVLDRHVENSNNKEAYLCGSPGMINACVSVLMKKGFTEDIIFYDKFG